MSGVASGEITEVSSRLITVRDQMGQDVSVKVDKDTKISLHGEPVSYDKLSAQFPEGTEVRVSYENRKGNLMATDIEASPADQGMQQMEPSQQHQQ